MSRAEYDAMPAQLTVRETRVRVKDKTKRVRKLVIVTTLRDAKIYRAKELGGLFRQRWYAELDLRSLKTDMHMEMLRTKSPEMVRKEVAMHLLAYNLIRGIMAEAARAENVKPRTLSFKGSLHTVRAFEQTHLYDPARIEADLPRLLSLIGKKRVGDRPDRYEPRAVKRRPKPHPLLRMTRKKAKSLIKRGIIPYNKNDSFTCKSMRLKSLIRQVLDYPRAIRVRTPTRPDPRPDPRSDPRPDPRPDLGLTPDPT